MSGFGWCGGRLSALSGEKRDGSEDSERRDGGSQETFSLHLCQASGGEETHAHVTPVTMETNDTALISLMVMKSFISVCCW